MVINSPNEKYMKRFPTSVTFSVLSGRFRGADSERKEKVYDTLGNIKNRNEERHISDRRLNNKL